MEEQHNKLNSYISKSKFKLIFYLLLVLLLAKALIPDKPRVPREGDVVTWLIFSPELIVKTKLGQRREHIVVDSRIDDVIYEPEYERFLGQFPIDFTPESFPKMTSEELSTFLKTYNSKVNAVRSGHFLEFYLVLNDADFTPTDRSIYSSEALEDINQVKVQIRHYGANRDDRINTTRDGHEHALTLKQRRYDKQSSDEYGLECYFKEDASVKTCFGESKNPKISGVRISITGDNWISGQSWEPIFGGIHVHWRIDQRNLKHWPEVDQAIWRLLDGWNVSPLTTVNQN